MTVTEVRVDLADHAAAGNDRIRAFASVVFDGSYKVHDVKVVARGGGGLIVSMPSRKLTERCGWCGDKNALSHRFCCECGSPLPDGRGKRDDLTGRVRTHADIFHPLTHGARAALAAAVLAAYHAELEASKLPGYVSGRERVAGATPAEGGSP